MCLITTRNFFIFSWCHPGDCLEFPAEIAYVIKSGDAGNFANGHIVLFKKGFCVVYLYFVYVLYNTFARFVFKKVQEVRLAHIKMLCQCPDR